MPLSDRGAVASRTRQGGTSVTSLQSSPCGAAPYAIIVISRSCFACMPSIRSLYDYRLHVTKSRRRSAGSTPGADVLASHCRTTWPTTHPCVLERFGSAHEWQRSGACARQPPLSHGYEHAVGRQGRFSLGTALSQVARTAWLSGPPVVFGLPL